MSLRQVDSQHVLLPFSCGLLHAPLLSCGEGVACFTILGLHTSLFIFSPAAFTLEFLDFSS